MASAEPAPGRTVVCAGMGVYDYVFRLEDFPRPGEKKRAREFTAVVGGGAANAAVAIARLGGRPRFAAPLGGPAGIDAAGDRILRDLAANGVDCSGAVRLAGVSSPISAILIDASGERMIANYRADRLTEIRVSDPDALVAGADALLVDNRFSEFVLPICQAARARGIIVVLDGDRSTREDDPLFAAASHIVFAADGLRATTGCDDLGDGLRRIAAVTSAFVGVTDGPRGALWLERGAVRHMPAFPVAAIDTLAAGDVFHGAFALSLAEGQTEVDAFRFAAVSAAIKCTRFGGSEGAPKRAEVIEFLAQRPFHRA